MIISSCFNLCRNLISILYFIKLYLQMLFETVWMFTGFVSNNKLFNQICIYTVRVRLVKSRGVPHPEAGVNSLDRGHTRSTCSCIPKWFPRSAITAHSLPHVSVLGLCFHFQEQDGILTTVGRVGPDVMLDGWRTGFVCVLFVYL